MFITTDMGFLFFIDTTLKILLAFAQQAGLPQINKQTNIWKKELTYFAKSRYINLVIKYIIFLKI